MPIGAEWRVAGPERCNMGPRYHRTDCPQVLVSRYWLGEILGAAFWGLMMVALCIHVQSVCLMYPQGCFQIGSPLGHLCDCSQGSR